MAEQSTFDGGALPTARAVLVIGAGTMGRGIAEVAASAAHRVSGDAGHCVGRRRRRRNA
jgi:prephenate dehydrogenase